MYCLAAGAACLLCLSPSAAELWLDSRPLAPPGQGGFHGFADLGPNTVSASGLRVEMTGFAEFPATAKERPGALGTSRA